MADYFSTLGKAMASELARNPAQRERIRQVANKALNSHLCGPMARDEKFTPGMRPRGSEQYNNGDQDPSEQAASPPSPDECMMFIETLLAKLPPDQHDDLIQKLAELIQGAHSDNGGMDEVLSNNRQVFDKHPRRAGGRDNQVPRPGMDRRQAQDSAIRSMNHNSFQKRWGKLFEHVTVLG